MSHLVYAILALPLPERSCTNITSSAKPEAHDMLHCHQRTTEPRPHTRCAGNFVKFAHEIYERTYRDTDTLIAILRTATGGRGGEVREGKGITRPLYVSARCGRTTSIAPPPAMIAMYHCTLTSDTDVFTTKAKHALPLGVPERQDLRQ